MNLPPTTQRHPFLGVALFLAVLVGAAVGLAGCAGYSLGPTNHRVAGERSIQVNPFQNTTLEPRLTAEVGNALRKAFQQDGTFRLDTRDGGDILLSGTIVRFDRRYLSLNPKDVISPRDYRVSLTARVVATERGTGKVLVDRDLVGYTTVRVGADVNSAEIRSIPLVAEALARHATSLLVDGEW